MQRLLEAAEKAKIELELAHHQHQPAVITADQNGPKHLDITVTRAVRGVDPRPVEKTMGPTRQALQDATVPAANRPRHPSWAAPREFRPCRRPSRT